MKLPYRFKPTQTERIAFVNMTPEQRKTVTNYLTVYGYAHYVNIYGDIIVHVPHNAVTLSNIRNAVNKLTGEKIGVTFFSDRFAA